MVQLLRTQRTEAHMALPDFIIMGAPKCGTTALHVALDQHPDLFLSRAKEPKFFLTSGPPPTGGGPGDAATYAGYVWRQSDYEALFADAPPDALRGESTTLYLRDFAAHQRIATAVPHARLIAILRDPVDRAHSNWVHLRGAGLEPDDDFLSACAREDERAAAGWGPFWRYVDLGRYGAQLQNLFSVVPREQVLVLLYRELREEPLATLDKVTSFLGVRPGLVTSVPSANVTAHVSSSWVNRALAATVRSVVSASHRLPPRADAAAGRMAANVARLLQREQRLRAPLRPDERKALLPASSTTSTWQKRSPGWICRTGATASAISPVHRFRRAGASAPRTRASTAPCPGPPVAARSSLTPDAVPQPLAGVAHAVADVTDNAQQRVTRGTDAVAVRPQRLGYVVTPDACWSSSRRG
jgi:hypothetical protein